MKKLLVILTALAMTFGFAAGAYAVNQVQVTLTSPTIVKQGCEKAGSVTFAFDGGSTITAGDYWYMDLPTNVTICKPFDYMITGNATIAADTVNINGGTNATVFTGATIAIPAMAAGTTVGPLTYSTVSGAAAPLVRVGSLALRVVGSGRRVTITAYGAAPGDSIAVAPSHRLAIAILNGNMQNAGNPSAAAAYPANILLDTANTPATTGDGVYGNSTTAAGDLLAGPLPDVNNTLCINAESYGTDLVFVSFASLNDIYTFTGDSQIAHVGAAAQLTLASCKGDITGNIEIGGQGTCTFDYETATGYCPAPPATFVGNRILVQGTSTFGLVGDRYSMTVTSDTAGVYFGGTPTLGGFIPTATTQCTAAGTGIAAAFTPETASTKVGVTYPGSCVFTSLNRVVKVATAPGGITGIDTYDRIYVNLPVMYYDGAIIGNGVEADVTITIGKYPCGDFFTASRTVGTFVTTCPVGAGGTALMYPFFPPLDGSIPGWWGGFTVNNAGTDVGTATLTFWEMDGDTATLTTPSIAAGGMWVDTFANILANATPGAANTGTFGDSNVMITVSCKFQLGGGFAFLGNGNEGTGYTAYVLGAGGWQ